MVMVDELLKMAKELEPYVLGFEGNVSCKHDNGFYIKASGKSLKFLEKDDLVLCDSDGKVSKSYTGKNLPSIEVGFHSWLLNNFDINFVAHTHPTNTLKILCSTKADKFAKQRLFPDQVVFNGAEYCLVDYFHPGRELLGGIKISMKKYISKYKKPPNIVLLKNHGIITFGKTMKECVLSTEICEKAADIFLGSIFSPKYLTKESIDKIIKDDKEKFRKSLL